MVPKQAVTWESVFLSLLRVYMSKKYNSGFTLVELSIVIVIIGLIVGGVVAGQGLVLQSKLRRSISEVDNIKKAHTAFKLEYDALPGDMVNASSYWSGATNGDGNGKIDTESFLAWRHLILSGIYPGSYTGIATVPAVAGQNVPTTPFGANSGKTSYWLVYRHFGGNAIYGKTAHSINLSSYSSLINAWVL